MIKGVKPVDGAGGRGLLREAIADHANNGHAYRLGREITFRDEAAPGKELTVDDITVARYREEIAELVTTDTIYLTEEKRHPKIKVQSIAPLLAKAISRIHRGETVSPLLRLL